MAGKVNRVNIVLEADDRGSVKIKNVRGNLRDLGNQAHKTSLLSKQAFDNMGASVRSFARSATVMLAGAATALGYMGKKSLDAADQIGKTADAAGISTTILQEYRHAAELSGVSTATLDKSMEKFGKTVGELRFGTGALYTLLNKNNKELLNQVAAAKSTDQALNLVMNAMAGTADQTERSALAAAAFGRSGTRMTIMVKDGTEGLAKMRQEAEEMGLVLDENLIRGAEDANDKLETLSKMLSTTFTSAVIELAPDIAQMATEMANWVKANKEMISSGIVKTIDDIRNGVVGIKNAYDSLPPEAIAAGGAGLLGLLLLGPTGGILLAATAGVITRIKGDIDDLKVVWDNLTKGDWSGSVGYYGGGGGAIGKQTKAIKAQTAAIKTMATTHHQASEDMIEDMYSYRHWWDETTESMGDDWAAINNEIEGKFKETVGPEGEAVKTVEEGFGEIGDLAQSQLTAVFQGEFTSIGDFFKDMLNNMYSMFTSWVSQIAAQKIVFPVVMSVVGGATAAFAGTDGGASGGFSLSNLLSGASILKGWDNFSTGMSGGFQQSVASFFGNSNNLAVQDFGMALSNMNPMMFNPLLAAGADLLMGGNIGSAAMTATGTALGTMAMPFMGPLAPLGPVLGAILPKIVSSIFGGKKKPKYVYHGSTGGLDEAGNFIPGFDNHGVNPASYSYTGSYYSAGGKHTDASFDQAMVPLSTATDQLISDVLSGYSDWFGNIADTLPKGMETEFLDKLKSIDFTWDFSGDDVSPDEESLQANIEGMLANLNDQLWGAYGNVLTEYTNKGLTAAFENIDVNITEPLLTDTASLEDFQAQATNAADRLDTLTQLSISLGETDGPSKFQQGLNAIDAQFDALEAKLKAEGATTAELTELTRLQTVAEDQYVDAFKQNSADYLTQMYESGAATADITTYINDFTDDLLEMGYTVEDVGDMVAQVTANLVNNLVDAYNSANGITYRDTISARYGGIDLSGVTTGDINSYIESILPGYIESGLDPAAYLGILFPGVSGEQVLADLTWLYNHPNSTTTTAVTTPSVTTPSITTPEDLLTPSEKDLDEYKQSWQDKRDDFFKNITDQFVYDHMSEYSQELNSIINKWDEAIQQANELGLSEERLVEIRKMERQSITEYIQSYLQDQIDLARQNLINAYSASINTLKTKLSDLASEYNEAVKPHQEIVDRWKSIVDNVKNAAESLEDVTRLSPEVYTDARKEFQETLRAIFAGDTEKASNIGSTASNYASSLINASATSLEYRRQFYELKSQLISAEQIAGAKESVEQQIVDTLTKDYELKKKGLEAQIQYENDQMQLLQDIKQGTIDIATATKELNIAKKTKEMTDKVTPYLMSLVTNPEKLTEPVYEFAMHLVQAGFDLQDVMSASTSEIAGYYIKDAATHGYGTSELTKNIADNTYDTVDRLDTVIDIMTGKYQHKQQVAVVKSNVVDPKKITDSQLDAYTTWINNKGFDASTLSQYDLAVGWLQYKKEQGFATGGIATGPTSGYPATLHGTEAIIPLGKGDLKLKMDNSDLKAEIRELKEIITNIGIQQLKWQQKTAKKLSKWDGDGIPAERVA